MKCKNLLIITQSVDENDFILAPFLYWFKELSKYYDNVFIICQRKGKYKLPHNIKVFSLCKEKNYSKLRRLIIFYKLIWQLHHKYDKLFVHMIPAYVLLGMPLWKLLNKKIYLWYAHGHVNSVLKMAVLLCNKVFTSTKGGCNIKFKNIEIIGQGLDSSLFKFNEKVFKKDRLNIITLGRITKIKNIDVIIDAINIINRYNINIKLTIVGGVYIEEDKTYLSYLRKKVETYNINRLVNFVGSVNHKKIPLLLKEHNLMINACSTTSFDKVILEAMACGVPVITSNNSFKGIISNNLIFKEKNVEDLAIKIKNFIEMPKNTKRNISNKLSKYVEHNHNLKKLIEVIVKSIN